MGLLRTLKPQWWFSAHLHVRFQAIVRHEQCGTGPIAPSAASQPQNPDEITIADDFDAVEPQDLPIEVPRVHETLQNPDEITLEDEEEEVIQLPHVAYQSEPSVTKFLALDKCLPKREFMEVCSLVFSCMVPLMFYYRLSMCLPFWMGLPCLDNAAYQNSRSILNGWR